jgi:radical SAM protein with 4Fe4S-binding SPASM domain
MTSTSVKKAALDRYYHLARTTALRHVHNRSRRWWHRWRYGVNSAFMFRNVEVEINSMCNRKCSYCPNVSATRPVGYIQDSLFRKIIDDLAEMDFDGNVSYHFYGEPLLDKRLLDFVKYTSSNVPKCKPVIYSNGDFLTLDVLRQYIASGVDVFLVTQHDNYLPPNLRQIVNEARDDEKRHIIIRFANQIEMNNRSGLIDMPDTPTLPLDIPCDWPLASIVVTMNGNVVPCCNDYNETEVVGSLRTHSIREVWCSERFENFRSALSRGDRKTYKLCANCDAIPHESKLARIVEN